MHSKLRPINMWDYEQCLYLLYRKFPNIKKNHVYIFSIFLETDGANLFPTSKQRAGNSRNFSDGTAWDLYCPQSRCPLCCGNKMECTRLWTWVNLSAPAPSEWIITITQLCETQWVHTEYITHRPTSSHPPSTSLSPPLSPSSETQVFFVMLLSNLVGLADSLPYTDFHLQLTQPRPWPQ